MSRMAKFSSCYTLCPLIDQSLLGVEKDKEPDCAIVTLGRNIVIRYKLQDLKQISSWSSKERLTTQVIYDRSKQRYVAVFNENKIRVWSEDETDLNSVKGYKFRSPFRAILLHDDASPILVQQNGATASLDWAIENRKTWMSKDIIRSNEKLLDCQLIYSNGKTSLFYLTKVEDVYNYIVFRLKDETYLEKADTVKRIELKQRSEDLRGHTVIHHQNNAYLLTFTSQGRLYSHFLTGTSTDSNLQTTRLISVITNINTSSPVVMTHFNDTTIAIYGADIADEGAILMIYNVQYKLVQAVQKLKLYTNDAKLWKMEDKLLLAANRHLAVASYHLRQQRISAVLDSSLCVRNESVKKNADDVVMVQDAIVAQWDKNQIPLNAKNSTSQIPSNISKQIHAYLNEGWTDASIQEVLISNFIESNDIASICSYLSIAKDLPEKLLVDLLAFALKSPDKVFVSMQNGTTDNTLKDNPYSRNGFLAKILNIEYSSVALLPYLKTGLTFDEVLKLLEYLMHKLSEEIDSFDDNPQPSDRQIYEWFSMLFDSHYQHYLLSQDAYVLKFFNRLDSILKEHFQFLQDLQNLRSVVHRINNGKSLRFSSRHNKFYSIEEIKLY